MRDELTAQREETKKMRIGRALSDTKRMLEHVDMEHEKRRKMLREKEWEVHETPSCD